MTMLDRLRPLLGHHVRASDGPIGRVVDFYIDDCRWVARYLVVDTGEFLGRNKILLSPTAIVGIDWGKRTISLAPSVQQVKDSPHIDLDKPVHRRLEMELFSYYGWVAHWMLDNAETGVHTEPDPETAPFLCGMNDLRTYEVVAPDGAVGTLNDFIAHHDEWRIPLIILDTRHHLGDAQVVVSSLRLRGVRSEEKTIAIDMTRADLEKAPHFEPDRQLTEYLEILRR